MRFPSRLVLTLAALPALGCSSKDSAGSGPGGTGPTWERIIESAWTLGPGEEITHGCEKVFLEEDIYVTAIRPVHPPGTHHTLLTLGNEKTECTSAVAGGLLYAAALGSEGLTLPPGVAIKFPRGQYLGLGLHLYNTTEKTLTGTSGMEIVRMDAKDVKEEAETVLTGPVTLNIPPGESTIEGDCDVTEDQTVFALFPHMHQHGVHFKTTMVLDGVEEVIHDGAFEFDEQSQTLLEPPIVMHAGDKIRSACTYRNAGADPITFGESSDTEMCFSIVFRYPKLGQGLCTPGGTISIPGPPCAEPGATGNDLGVGKECTKGGGECQGNGNAQLCLNDVINGDFGNFCTLTCDTDAECGADATCQGQPGRRGCIPSACLAGGTPATDAGADGG